MTTQSPGNREETAEVVRGILETSPVGIVVFSADREVLRVNRRAQEILGMSRADVTDSIEDTMTISVVNEDRVTLPEAERPTERVLDTGEAVYGLTMGVPNHTSTDEGEDVGDAVVASSVGERAGDNRPEYTWLSVNAAPLRDDAGEIDRIVATFEDVTERRLHVEQLARQNERLDQFAEVVSHDLRNPLSVARGYLQIAREDGDDEAYDRIEESLDRMATLIDDLLSLAREGESAGTTERVSVAEVAREAWETVETGRASLEATTDVVTDAAPDRLRTLFENLFRNSVEHGAHTEDASRLTVRVVDLVDGGFAVVDDGQGIPPALRDHVFERGFTTDDGTGFGLDIVREVAVAHDWRVVVAESDAGGARFEVKF